MKVSDITQLRVHLWPVRNDDSIMCILLTDECCYWYKQLPAAPSSTCDGDVSTAFVFLICEVHYQPSNNFTNVEVKWYRSTREETAGNKGENIIVGDGKYDIFLSKNLSKVDVFIKQYVLVIRNFNVSEDGGYYWCQIVVNNISLSPSPYGHINSQPCSFLASCFLDHPLCAHNSTLQLEAYIQPNGTNCNLQDHTSSKTSTAIILDIPTVTMGGRARCNFSNSGYPCAAGVLTGTIILITSLVVSVLCLLFFFQKNRKNQGICIIV